MKGCLLKVAHEEIISLVNQGVDECEAGDASAGVSILLEAQFLISDLIEHQLNRVLSTPPLSPLMGDCADGGEVPSRCLENAE